MSSEGAVVKVLGRGPGGVEEMQAAIDESQVTFGLLKFEVGSGTFARKKYLAVHFNLETISVIKRGRVNAKKGAVKAAMGSTHADLTVEEKAEFTLDFVLEHMAKVFVSDKDMGGGEFSISKLKEDYEAMIVKETLAAAKLASAPGKRATAAEMEGVTSHKALDAVREPMGPFNWCIFAASDSKLDFINAGSLGINEMRDWLKDDQVCFGVIRMGFGAGDFRRTKWLFLHWSGESVGAVKRGRANACRDYMHTQLSPVSVDFSATSLDEFTLEGVIDRVKKTVVVDGETKGDDATDPFTLEAYMAALEEEAKASAAFFGDAGGGGGAAVEYGVEESLKLIHSDTGGVSWILFAPL